MFVSLLCAASSIFSFGGGSDEQLASAITRQRKQPVVILADGRRKWPKIEIKDSLNENQVNKVMASVLGTTPISEKGFGVCSAGWPEAFYRKELRSNYEGSFKRLGKVVFKDLGSRISIHTEGGPVPLGNLLTRDIVGDEYSWHWFFEGVNIFVSCDKISRQDFANLIADALGATLNQKQGSKSKYLDLNPKEFRSRTTTLANQRFKSFTDISGEKYDYLLLSTGLSLIKDSDIVKLMELPDKKMTFDMSKSQSFQKTAWQRLEAQYPVDPQDGIKRHPSVIQTWNTIRKLIDFDKPVNLILYSNGMAACHFGGTASSSGGVVL